MKTRNALIKLGTRTILGKRVTISEFKNVRFYRIGNCNVSAANVEDAIAKYIKCIEAHNQGADGR
jgi:hypothetical protein